MFQCLEQVNSWIQFNYFSYTKTSQKSFGNKEERLKVHAQLDSRTIKMKAWVNNICILIGHSIHIKAITKSAFYNLKQIARIKSLMLRQDAEKFICAFISREDYCNSLLSDLHKKLIQQLQLNQNAAVKVLTRTRTTEHITPVLQSLHWLPDTYRKYFKVLLLVYKLFKNIEPNLICLKNINSADVFRKRSYGSGSFRTKHVEAALGYDDAQRWH